MGKIDSRGISFIRDVFRRDKQGQDLAISTKELAANASISGLGASMDILQSGDLHGMLSLDRGMLQRFYDYESMDEYSDISSALDIYADDSTQEDSSDGKVLWVECNDDSIKEELMDMYYKRIDIDNNIWPISRGLCKMGNDYEEIIVGDGGVVGLSFLPAKTMRRIENKKGDLFGFMQTFSDNLDFTPEQFEKFRISGGSGTNDTKDVAAFEDWRVVHMRLTAKYRESLYGWSVIDPARWVWKRLMLLEDAVLVYKLTRSPSRYAFYIDVGKVPKYEAQKILRESMQQLKKRKFINPKTGKLDLRANPMSMDQDFFFATREGRETTRVESLMGPAYQQVDDVQYFLYKLYAALKIPRAYMGYDENMPSRATLSQEDVRFARTILRVQREIRNGMKKVARVNLAARRIDPAAVDFDIKMTVPSSIFELGQMEARRARADLASMMERHVSMYWLMKHIYKMSDDEIEDIAKQKKAERAAGVDQQVQEDNRGFESVSGGRIIRNRFGRSGMITERELFSGNREDEKRIEGMVRREIENPNSLVGRQLRENANLLREILHTMKAA
jgi:hypothetical protein